MCGIGGYVLPALSCPEESISEQLECIRYRGPDGNGEFAEEVDNSDFRICLGHVRLSIIDIEGGLQPMSDEEKRFTVVFNGEIYNYLELKDRLKRLGHRFSTESDTEVLLHSYMEWGSNLVEMINGQFSFVIWDSGSRSMFAARDHFGLKPFYYIEKDGGIIFASEIKAIREISNQVFEFDESVLPEYLRHRYVPNPKTMFRGVRKLPPGSYAQWDVENGLVISRYFEPLELGIGKSDNYESGDLVEEFNGLLESAVSRRMMSDVPFGAFLSGGLDSSTIVAKMSKISDLAVSTFSVGFEDGEDSELEYSRRVADLFGCDHNELIIRAEDLPGHLEDLIHLRDAPISEPSDIPIFLLSKFASSKVKMVLTGEGADEILGGYDKYYLERYGRIYRKLTPKFVRSNLVERVFRNLPERLWRWKFAINTVGMDEDSERVPMWFGGLDSKMISDVMRSDLRADGPIGQNINSTNLRGILDFDQRYWLPDNLLERGDRMTMGASIEARMPFMDVDLARFSSNLPDKMRLSGRRTKVILREAMSDDLPKSIINRPKIGFRVPVREWFRGDLSEWVSELLVSNNSRIRKYLRSSELTKIIGDHRAAIENHEKAIWSLINLELFLRSTESKN